MEAAVGREAATVEDDDVEPATRRLERSAEPNTPPPTTIRSGRSALTSTCSLAVGVMFALARQERPKRLSGDRCSFHHALLGVATVGDLDTDRHVRRDGRQQPIEPQLAFARMERSVRASARIMSGAGSAAGASHNWTKLPCSRQHRHLLGSPARPAQVERIDTHAGVGLVRLGDERERIIDRPDGAPAHELERDVHAIPCGHPAQPGELVQRRVPVVGGDDCQQHSCADLGGGIGRPDRAHRVEIRAEEKGLDIQRPDPESTAGAPDVADGGRVVDHLVLEAEVGRGEEAQPDGIRTRPLRPPRSARRASRR